MPSKSRPGPNKTCTMSLWLLLLAGETYPLIPGKIVNFSDLPIGMSGRAHTFWLVLFLLSDTVPGTVFLQFLSPSGKGADRHVGGPPRFFSINSRFWGFIQNVHSSFALCHFRSSNFPFMASFVELKAALYVEFLSRPGGDNFAPFRYLFRWKDAHIDWPFLRAAMRYWYPRYHVFRFGLDEICPVFEEGCAVLGLNPNAAIACPGTSGNLPLMARRWLGLSKNQTRGAVSGRFIHIGMICQHFVAHRYDRWVDLYLPRLVLVLLFLDVLLVNSSPLISLEYLEVVRQAFSGYNYAAIVLGESFVWLDRNRVRSNSGERGSPVLLYIWLSERFKMASRPLLFDNLASSFFDRDRPYLLEGDDDNAFDFWEIWFSGLGLRRIRWRVLWWGVSFVTVRLAGLGCLQYPSFGKPIPYFPFRVGRQFGWDQWYVPLGRRAPVLGEVRLLQSAWSLENRGGEDFNAVTNGHVSFGVAADLAEITAKAIWRDCREGFQLDPVMGAWLEGRDSFEDVYPVYRVIEDDRRANANAREYGTDDDTGSLDGFD